MTLFFLFPMVDIYAKKYFKFIRADLLVVLFMMCISSCAHPSDILGEWKEPGKASILEFRQDGTFKAVDDMGMVAEGTFDLRGDDRILFKLTYPDGSEEILTGNFILRKHELILLFEGDKETLRYRKD